MKKLIIVLMIALTATACDKVSHNGDLDGMWHLQQIDTIGGGSKNVSSLRIFYSVNLNLIQLSNIEVGGNIYLSHFEHKSNTLTLKDIYDTARKDSSVLDTSLLNIYGVKTIPQSFIIKKLTSSKLELETNKLRLSFLKR